MVKLAHKGKNYYYTLWFSYLLDTFSQRRQWHPTPVHLPGKSMDRGAWQAAVHGVAKSRTRLSDFTFTFYFPALEKKWQFTPLFLPGESQGRGSLVGCRLWGLAESDMTEATQQQQQQQTHSCVAFHATPRELTTQESVCQTCVKKSSFYLYDFRQVT